MIRKGEPVFDKIMLKQIVALDRQRIDKWLWHARVVRTRSAAAALCDAGLVRINGARIDSRAARCGPATSSPSRSTATCACSR